MGILGLGPLINEVCSSEREGGSVLADVLLSRNQFQSLMADVNRNDLLAIGVWYVWWERRQFTHGELLFEPMRSAQAILALAKNFTRAQSKDTRIKRHGWNKPPDGLVKLNVDATFDQDRGTGSTGAILRDDAGFFLAASCVDIPFVEDAGTAEARGLRDGLLLANDMGCNKIYVEADCMEVIEIMQNGGHSLGLAATIYEECSFLARNFISIEFSHCPREANMAADLLATSILMTTYSSFPL